MLVIKVINQRNVLLIILRIKEINSIQFNSGKLTPKYLSTPGKYYMHKAAV